MKTIIKKLSVKLTDAEFTDRANEIAKAHSDLNQKELERKSAADTFKGELKIIAANIQRLAHTIETKEEVRPVECYEKFDFERRQVLIIRKDTGATVESRPMSSDELQAQLFEREGYAN